MKKLLSVLLAALIAAGAVSVFPAAAEETATSPDSAVTETEEGESSVSPTDEPAETATEALEEASTEAPFEAPTEPAAPITGDVNGDGKVDITDATLIQKYAAGLTDFDDMTLAAADVNGDGSVNIADATAVQRIAAGLSNEEYAQTLTLSNESLNMDVGDTFTLHYEIPEGTLDHFAGYSTDNEAVAVVDENGTVTAVGKGTATVTASLRNGFSAACTVTVEQPAPSVELSQTALTLYVSQTYTLTYQVPAGSVVRGTEWSTDAPDVAAVDENGLVTAVGEGEAVVTLTLSNGVSASCTVTVLSLPDTLTLNKSTLTLGASEHFALIALASDTDVTSVADYQSDNPSVASVNHSGGITASGTGTAVITASLPNGATASCKVTVKPMSTALTLNADSLTLGISESFDIDSTVPSGTAAYSRDYVSDDPSVATVTKAGGIVTAVGEGTTTVRCVLQNGTQAVCPVTVLPLAESVTLNKRSLQLGKGESYTLVSSVPEGSAAFYRTFASDNPSVVSVDENGKLTALQLGSAKISVTLKNGAQAVCSVTVYPNPSSLTLNRTSITLGTTEHFKLVCTSSEGDVSEFLFYQSSNPSVVSVNASGQMTALAAGSATVTASLPNGTHADCAVTVLPIAPSMTLNKTELTLGISESYDIDSSVPSGTAAYERDYYSDNPSVATVTVANGIVKAVGTGTAVIRCVMQNGTTATCTVTVLPMATSLTLNTSEILVKVGGTFDVNSSVPSGTAAYYRDYYSDNTSIVSITKGGGIVTGLKTGRTTIRCVLQNGVKVSCPVYVYPESQKIEVPIINQSALGYPSGCEICSASIVMQYYGIKVTPSTMNQYVVKVAAPNDPNQYFVGDPTTGGYGVYAPAMVKFMNSCLTARGESYTAQNIQGKSLDYICKKYVSQGNPVMVWATINMNASYISNGWWRANEHCLVLRGYDASYYYFSDPWNGCYLSYSRSLVDTRYAELGKNVIVLNKK